eukprot:1573496-Pleurochrysis_carterae.AAC.8
MVGVLMVRARARGARAHAQVYARLLRVSQRPCSSVSKRQNANLGFGILATAQNADFRLSGVFASAGCFQTMSDSVLNALRRRLPVTKVKFDWDNKASVHKLASELSAAKVR